MLRLLTLIAISIAALLYVMAEYGTGEPLASTSPAEPVVAVEEVIGEVVTGLLPETSAEPEPIGTEGEPPADLVQVEEETPAQVQDFPGPDLKPSPEYAGQTPEEPQTLDSAEGPILYVTGSSVNFRSGPTTSDRVVGALTAGAPVEAIGPTDGEWVQIRDADGRIGYMSGQFLSQTAP